MFLRTEHARAIQCYRDVLNQKPNNYKALRKLIDLLRRGGTLDEVTTKLMPFVHSYCVDITGTLSFSICAPRMDDLADFRVSSWFRYSVAVYITSVSWPRLVRKHIVRDAVLVTFQLLHYNTFFFL